MQYHEELSCVQNSDESGFSVYAAKLKYDTTRELGRTSLKNLKKDCDMTLIKSQL
jgi:hypothetical protein